MRPTPALVKAGLIVWCLIAISVSGTRAETVRFSPGNEAPLAYNSSTGVYEQRLNLDPLFCAEEPCIELLHNIFEPLVSTAADQSIEPQLAVRWKRLDPRTYRFWLRRGVTFHNGEPFDSAAVLFSLTRASDAYGRTAWFPEIDRVQAVDEFTVDVVLRRPDSVFLHRLANIGLILPPRYFREVGPRRFGARPIGTGAFRFVDWDKARREIRLEANRSYWRTGYPELDRVVYAYMDSAEALEQLIAGDLHLIRRLHPRKTRRFMETDAGYIVKAWLPQLVIGPFNLLKPATPLRDLRVRRAINLAVNREHLVRYGAIGNGRILAGYTTPEDRHHADLDPYRFDIALAKQLLTEAGYETGLTLAVLVDQQVPPQIENIVEVSLRRIGIEITVKRASEAEFLNELYLPKFGSNTPPSFDILLLSMPAGTINHAAMVPMTLLYSKKPNESALRDHNLDQLYEDALGSYDPAEGRERWQSLERYVHRNHLLFIGYQENAVFGVHHRFRFTPRTLMTFWDAFFVSNLNES